MLDRTRLESLLSAFPQRTIGLVGDLFLDRYLEIEPGSEETSIETGLEAFQVRSVRNSPGALGTVMNNLAALGVGKLVPVTVIGDDGHGYDLLQEVRKLPIDDSHIIQDRSRLTPTYIKPMKQDADRLWRERNRLDVRSRGPLSAAIMGRLETELKAAMDACDGLIVLDQIGEPDWGVINSGIRRLLNELAAQTPEKVMYIDSRSHLGRFRFGILKGNRSEVLRAAKETAGRDVSVEEAARQLLAKTNQPVVVTLGEDGILVTSAEGQTNVSPAFAVRGPIDIVGAGDSATSGIVAALLSGASLIEAAELGNLVASITIQQLGTTGTATPAQLLARHAELD